MENMGEVLTAPPSISPPSRFLRLPSSPSALLGTLKLCPVIKKFSVLITTTITITIIIIIVTITIIILITSLRT